MGVSLKKEKKIEYRVVISGFPKDRQTHTESETKTKIQLPEILVD